MTENLSYPEVYEFLKATINATPDAATTSFYIPTDASEALAPNLGRMFSIRVKANARDITTDNYDFGRGCILEVIGGFRSSPYQDTAQTLNGALTDVATAVVYSGALPLDAYVIGDVIQVEAEQMSITGISPGTNTLTVTRGYNSTSAVAHADATAIFSAVTVTQIGATTSLVALKDTAFAGCALTFGLSVTSNVAQVMPTVTGVAATTVVWHVIAEVMIMTTDP